MAVWALGELDRNAALAARAMHATESDGPVKEEWDALENTDDPETGVAQDVADEVTQLPSTVQGATATGAWQSARPPWVASHSAPSPSVPSPSARSPSAGWRWGRFTAKEARIDRLRIGKLEIDEIEWKKRE